MVKTVGDALMPTNHRILISSLIDALDRLIARHPDLAPLPARQVPPGRITRGGAGQP